MGFLFREQELRHPLQEIPVGDCTLLLGDFGVFIFNRYMPHYHFTPLRLFVCKNCHTHMEISDPYLS